MSTRALTPTLVQYGTAEAIREAIAAGADVEARDAHFRTPLMIAVESGNLDTARALLEAGADVEARDDDMRRWARRMAADLGADVFEAMLDGVRDAQQQSPTVAKTWSRGNGVLDLAVRAGNAAMVRLLLDHGANVNARRSALWSVVEQAVTEANEAVLDALLERSSSNASDVDQALLLAARNKRQAIVRRLLRAGADPNMTCKWSGQRLLEDLVMEFQHDAEAWPLVRELVEVGAGGGAHALYPGIVPLRHPAETLMLRVLLDAGADVEARGRHDRGPVLAEAAEAHDRAALTCLLQYGARPDATDHPLAYAVSLRDGPSLTDIVTLPRILLDAGANPANAMWRASAAALEYMLLTGADPDTRSSTDGATLLMAAAAAEAPSSVRQLVAAGAELEARTHVRARGPGASGSAVEYGWAPAGRTALMRAAYAGQFDNVCVLLDAGADVHARSDDGVTALMIAHQVARDQRMVQRILAAGADPADLRPPRLVTVSRPPAWRPEPPPAIPEELLRHGSPDDIRKVIATLPHDAARAALDPAALSTAVRAGNLAGVRCLLEAGAQPNPAKHHTSPLHEAVVRHDLACVEALLDAGADPNHVDWYAERPLDYVGGWHDHPGPSDGGATVIRMLFDAGASFGSTQSIPRAHALANWYRWTDHDGSLEPARVYEALPWVTDLDLAAGLGDTTVLMLAAENGDLHTARLILGMGADPDARAADEATALVLAAAALRDAGSMVRLLIDAGSALAEADGLSALFAAARAGKPDAIRALLAHGVPPDGRLDGETALMRAAATGGPAAVATLLEAGADPDAAGLRHGWTPLMWAARHTGDPAVLRRLLDAGADVDARTPPFEERSGLDPAYRTLLRDIRPQERLAIGLSPGFTALMAAVTRAPSKGATADVVDTLLAAGADVDASCDDGRTALDLALDVGAPEAIARRLVAAGARPPGRAMRGSTGDTPREPPTPAEAAQRPAGDAVEPPAPLAGLPHAAWPRYAAGATLALIQAARRGDLTSLRGLIAAGAMGHRSLHDWGTTPLLSAFEHQHLDAVHLLLDAGADLEGRDRQGHTLLARIARAPIDRATDPAIAELLERLLRQGAHREARTVAGFTPLMLAAHHDHAAVAHALIRAGADVDARGGPWGVTALMVAARWGLLTDVIEALLAAGCDVEIRTLASETPRSTPAPQTVRRKHPPASPDAGETAPGRTALMCAAARRFRRHTTHALDALIAAGADVHARTDAAQTALTFATAIDPRSATVRRLLAAGAAPADRPAEER